MNPLKWLLTKSEPATKETTVTDTVVETPAEPVTVTTTVEPAATTQTTTTTVTSNDAVLDKVKEILISIGHDVEAEFDEVVALAKTPGINPDDLSARVQRLKETLEGTVYPDVTADTKDSK